MRERVVEELLEVISQAIKDAVARGAPIDQNFWDSLQLGVPWFWPGLVDVECSAEVGLTTTAEEKVKGAMGTTTTATDFRTIKATLEKRFIMVDDTARVLSLALSGCKNTIIYGPTGHAKSAMVDYLLAELGLAGESFVQFFGESTQLADVLGGLNFEKFDKERILEYYPERSFLNRRIAVFEELFDAPTSVLVALKDCLTAKALRNGHQYFPSKVETIICLTNKDPKQIASLGDDVQALVERFPLQLNLKWERYDAAAYLEMFQKVDHYLFQDGPPFNGSLKQLAHILGDASSQGNIIPPRTAVYAAQVAQAAAKMVGAKEVRPEDLRVLQHVSGLENRCKNLSEEIARAQVKAELDEKIKELTSRRDVLLKQLNGESTKPLERLKIAKGAEALLVDLNNLKVTDDYVSAYEQLKNHVTSIKDIAVTQAMEVTRV
jgi:hypothetical protein